MNLLTMKRPVIAVMLLLMAVLAAKAQTDGVDNTIRDGGEFYIYNVYYDRVLGGNADNGSPALSVLGANADKDSYVFVAEASSLHQGYYWLRQKSNGKYLQASNAEGNTWSVWYAGSLNKQYNSYEWGLKNGIDGQIISNRGEVINKDGNVWLGVDTGKESETYINVYYDKPLTERSHWQILDARFAFDESRLTLYTDTLDKAIALGEDVFNNPMYGTSDEKSELAAALYNARSIRDMATIEKVDTMTTALAALDAAIKNTQSANYTIWVSGSSFSTGEAFTIAMKGVKTNLVSSEETVMIVRNSKKTGAMIVLRDNNGNIGDVKFDIPLDDKAHDYQFAFDGKNVTVYIDGNKAAVAPQTAVDTYSSVGQGAEWTVFGESKLTTYRPEIISTSKALSPQETNINSYDKAEVHALKLIGQTMTLDTPQDYHINAGTPMTDSKIDIADEEAWLVFDNVRPSNVISTYLKDITINGTAASNGSNCRVGIYLHGAVVIPHKSAYKPFYGYSGQMFSGEEYNFGVGNNTLGEAENEIQSFILKRGYMVTLATESNGKGYSRVYVADHEDKRIDVLPDLLRHRVSFVNVRRWHYVSKKGWCNTSGQSSLNTEGKLMGATWFYTWSADKSTQTDMEYIPIKQHIYWPGWDQINNHTNSTAVLGYNEPDHSEQHESNDCSCGGVIDPWKATTHQPEFLASGMRIGSPSPTDASWLTKFIGHCNDMAYRCDFVAFHAYWGTNEAPNAESWRSQLKSIYDNTKRPIWITEWNNGASWTTESWPSSYGDKLSRQRDAIKKILAVLDGSDFVERYSVYNWDSYYRAMISWDSDKNSWWVTPAGEIYRDARPSHAYQEKMQFVPRGWFPGMKTDNKMTCRLNPTLRKLICTITNNNGDFTAEETIEYKTPEGEFATYYTNKGRSVLESTSARTLRVSCEDTPAEAYDADSLVIRLKITTLAGGVTYTEPCSIAMPPSLKGYYTDITTPAADGIQVVAQQGGVEINATQSVTINIYNVSGALLRTVTVDGKTSIPLPAGTYIVNGKKVRVQ